MTTSPQRRLVAIFLAVPAILHSASFGVQMGEIEAADGSRLVGELEFSKDRVNLKESSGKTHQFALVGLRSASLFEDPTQVRPASKIKPPQGLRGQYFATEDFTGDAVEQIDAEIDFKWHLGKPMQGIGPDNFSVRWEGQIEAPVSGAITFVVGSDDGSRLWIDGKLVVDHWGEHGAIPRSGTIDLEAGKRYPLRLDYFDRAQFATIGLRWSAKDLPKAIVPKSHLFAQPPGVANSVFPHWVRLKSGSEPAGAIISTDRTRLRLGTDQGAISIPVPALANVRFQKTWGATLSAQIDQRPAGCLLASGDFIEGTVSEFSGEKLKLDSLLFGLQSIGRRELRVIKFDHQSDSKPKFHLLTRSAAVLLADEITSLPGGRLKIRDSSGYHLTIPASHIKKLSAIPK